MMKILIATGVYPPQVGGPAYYAKRLKEELEKKGYEVSVLHFDKEHGMPTGIRHLYFLKRLWRPFKEADLVIALDTFSVGFPSALLRVFVKRKLLIRVGGDFLWEQYVERGNDVALPYFYNSDPRLNLKEKIIFWITKFTLWRVDAVIFSTSWLRDIFLEPYGLKRKKTFIVENYYPRKESGLKPKKKNFLWAGRDIKLKNVERFEGSLRIAKTRKPDIKFEKWSGIPREELMEKIKKCYAVVVPSMSEVSPNLILEAVKYSKPFICTEYMGLKDRVGELGLFIDPFDIRDIYEKILEMAEEETYGKLKDRSESFQFTHSYNEIAQEFLNIAQGISIHPVSRNWHYNKL